MSNDKAVIKNMSDGLFFVFHKKYKTLLTTFPQKGDLDLPIKQERCDWSKTAIDFAVKELDNNKKIQFT